MDRFEHQQTKLSHSLLVCLKPQEIHLWSIRYEKVVVPLLCDDKGFMVLGLQPREHSLQFCDFCLCYLGHKPSMLKVHSQALLCSLYVDPEPQNLPLPLQPTSAPSPPSICGIPYDAYYLLLHGLKSSLTVMRLHLCNNIYCLLCLFLLISDMMFVFPHLLKIDVKWVDSPCQVSWRWQYT